MKKGSPQMLFKNVAFFLRGGRRDLLVDLGVGWGWLPFLPGTL